MQKIYKPVEPTMVQLQYNLIQLNYDTIRNKPTNVQLV